MKRRRKIETTILDFCRIRGGGRIIDVAGRPFIGAEFFDDEDGRLLQQRLLIDVEELARAIADDH
jgi:hypothetical protein